MSTTEFTTESLRDLSFDHLSAISQDPTKFEELNSAYFTRIHERADANDLKKYTQDIYDKILPLQIVQTAADVQLKDSFNEKVVVVYFWTFSDIHSSHVMQKFLGIHKRYSTTGVTIIGVHSPKYEHEKNKSNIRHAIEEESLQFTVVNDNVLQLWKHVNCQIRPTVLVFGPDLLPIFIFEGDNHIQYLELFLVSVLAFYKSSIHISPHDPPSIKTLHDNTATNVAKVTKFTYPSHLCVTTNGQICISFAGSNQIIICEVDGKVMDIVGNGHSGMADGEIQQSEFDSPHGLVEYNSCIYIADTNNHAIRVYDPNSRRVLTLIGTGRLGTDKVGGLKRSQQPIASPWDLCITESPFDHKVVLLIAMAGHHQIWAYAFEETQWWNDVILEKNSCSAIVGNGTEGNKNGTEPMQVSLATPRGICNGIMNGESVLFVADSNSSSIRVITLSNGHVANLVGGDPDPTNLLAFGDLDGTGHSAKLQHPLGVVFHYPTSHLYFTDSFNNKLKRIDMKNLFCSGYFVTDVDTKKQRGEGNSAKFNEPCGIVAFDHYMYVADKNNSHIKRIDLDQGTIVRCRFDLTEALNEERTFGSKQAYLSIVLPETLQLREGSPGTWILEDEDGFKICDGGLLGYTSDQMLLDYVPRDKQIAQLKYELMICEDDKCSMLNGVTQPVNQTDSIIEFVIKIDQTEPNSN